MKENIHPAYHQTNIRCACGNEIETGSTKQDIRVEICSKCHPFFSGEMQRIVDMGVTLQLNTKVADVAQTMKDGAYDAVFLAVGAHIAKRAYIPAGSAAKMLDAVSVLRGMETGEKPQLGRRVVVYGGGNTAMDVARTAKRLGATESIIIYRRTRDQMPAHGSELEEALKEGVLVKWLSTIKHAEGSSITVEKMVLDEEGKACGTGEFEQLEADSVVLALGQDVDLGLLDRVPGLEKQDDMVKVGPDMMTSYPGIFAGGDMVPAERTVTVAIGHAGFPNLPARDCHESPRRAYHGRSSHRPWEDRYRAACRGIEALQQRGEGADDGI